jgi:multicomponent Na+:H+ antiporter subunit G
VTDWLALLSWVPLLAGAFFFLAGTVGLLRFPDIYSRLHAITKADTLGLGLVTLGLIMRAENWQAVAVMVLIWLLMMGSGATTCQLLARYQQDLEAPDADKEPVHARR